MFFSLAASLAANSTYLLCIIRSTVDQFISSDLVVGTTLGWGHPGQEDAGLRLGLALEF